ncbi:MAG: sulfite exporter TauE/SafE family protein [Ectothiorhodospiraceae bacterium]
MLTTLLTYLLAGAVAGLIAGLFGLGGGVVMVPVLLVVFAAQGLPEAVIMHMAVGSSLAVIVVTSLSSLRAHHRLGGVAWPVVARMAGGIAAGALAGAWLADTLSANALQNVFAVFLVAVAVKMGLGLNPAPGSRPFPGTLLLAAAGAVIGALSALVGIGGGTLTVPFLSWAGMAMRRAVGTSAACGLPIAAAGAAGFMLTGYVYWPAVGGLAAASVLVAPVGARLAHRLPGALLQRLFAALLLVVAARLLLS